MYTAQPIPLFLLDAAEPASAGPPAPATLPLRDLGTTYSMAQAVRWLDPQSFAIGRWDGTLTVFDASAARAPLVREALVAPSLAGVEMITPIAPRMFASSNDAGSIAVWRAEGAFDQGVAVHQILTYDPSYGVANDGTVTEIGGRVLLVSGHAEGFLLVWQASPPTRRFSLVRAVDLRSPDPVPSPFPLRNIRGVEAWRPGVVVTGSEDGDLCIVDVERGEVVVRRRYSPAAQRGINDIDVCGDSLLVASCSVGPSDRNLWLFHLDEGGIDLLDAVDLKLSTARPQTFNFCVDQAVRPGGLLFFAATQEGVVWVGDIRDGSLQPLGTRPVSTNYGAALAYEPTRRLLSVAGDNLHLFEVQ